MAYANPWGLVGYRPLELLHHLAKRKFNSYESCIIHLYQDDEPENAKNCIVVYVHQIRQKTKIRLKSIYGKGYQWESEDERKQFKEILDEIFSQYGEG
jgi:DNA-binding response OmpR family regulator